MSEDTYKLVAPDGTEVELPVHSGTLGPDLVDIGHLYRDQGVFTYDPGFLAS